MENEKMTKYYFEHDFSEFLEYIKAFNVRKRTYRAKELISSQADTLNNGYYIVEGIMKLSIGVDEENEKTLALFGPGSIFP